MAKIKKAFIYFGIIFIILNIYGIYAKYTYDYETLQEADLKKQGYVQKFEFSTKRGRYRIGILVKNEKFNKENFDGNYTIEYYLDGQHDRTEIINKATLLKLYKDKSFYNVSSSWSGGVFFKQITWDSITLGEVSQAGKHIIKITVHKPESQFKNIKNQLYFFVSKIDENIASEFKQSSIANKKLRLFENLIDVNETNKTLIPLRKALDNNDLEKVIKIVKADNSVAISTNMILQRRPLHYASFHNNTKIAQYLIDNGANIHHKDKLGKNALAYAIENNATKTAKLLIKNGVDISEVKFVQNYLQLKINGKYKPKTMVLAPLQYTAGNALFDMTELLLKHNVKNYEVWLSVYSGDIVIQDNKNGLYSYIYQNNEKLNNKERKKMLKLFEKYNFKLNFKKIPNPFKKQ